MEIERRCVNYDPRPDTHFGPQPKNSCSREVQTSLFSVGITNENTQKNPGFWTPKKHQATKNGWQTQQTNPPNMSKPESTGLKTQSKQILKEVFIFQYINLIPNLNWLTFKISGQSK